MRPTHRCSVSVVQDRATLPCMCSHCALTMSLHACKGSGQVCSVLLLKLKVAEACTQHPGPVHSMQRSCATMCSTPGCELGLCLQTAALYELMLLCACADSQHLHARNGGMVRHCRWPGILLHAWVNSWANPSLPSFPS